MRVVRSSSRSRSTSSSRSRSRNTSGGGGLRLLLALALATHRPDRGAARAYNPRAFGPGGAFRPPSSGSSAQGGRGTDRYGNTASDVVTGQGAAANPYDAARHQQRQQRRQQSKGAPQNIPNSNININNNNNNGKDDVNQPVISGERASMASRYSNSFSAFGDTVQQPRQAQAAAQSILETAPRYDGDYDDDDDSLGEETTTTATTDISTIRIVTRRGGVQKPPGYVGNNKTKKKKTNTKPLAKPITNQQQTSGGGGKADNRPPTSRPNQGAATTAAQPPPTHPMPPSASSSSSATKDVPQPVISGERASMAARYANSFSPYGSTAPPPEGPAQSSRARQLVGQMRTPPASPTTAAGGGGSSREGGGRPTSGGAAADGMRPVISGDRASMDNRYSNSLSAFGDTAPAPPTILQQQRAAKQSSAMMPRVAASASGGNRKAPRVVKQSSAPLPPRRPPPPPPQMRQPPKQPKQQQSAAAVDDPNRPVISGDRASLDNRYSNSFSPFTNEAASAKPAGGGGGGGGGRLPTDGPFPSVVKPPPMRRADVGSSPAVPLLPVMTPTIGGSGSGRAEAKKRKPMIIPRAEAPQTPSIDDNDLDEEMEEEMMAGKSTSATALVGSVTHNGDRAGNRNQNSFSAFGDTPVAPVIGGARTDDRYGNSFDSSGNVKPQTSNVASSWQSKDRPIPPAAVMNGDRAGGRNQNSFSAFGDTPAPGSMSKKSKPDIDDVTPPKDVSPRTTTTTQSKAKKPAEKRPQVEAPKAVLGGARVEDIYGNSLSAFGDVDLTKMKPRRKPAARFASPKSQADQKKQTCTDKKGATSADSRKKEVPKAIMNGARADDIYFNSFSAFGADVTKTPKAPRQASRPAKRVPAAYTGNPDITVSQDSGISGSSASNDHDRYGNAHHVYNSHVHALKHQEPIEDDEDGGIITKKERKWIIP